MNKKFTTIFLVSNDNNETKFITVPTKHVSRFKKYFIVGSLIIFASLLTILSLIFGIFTSKNEINQLSDKINELEQDVKIIDSLSIRQKIKEIEINIDDINKYLFDRGIIRYENSGGESNGPASIDLNIYDYYARHTGTLAGIIKYIPLGLPAYGEIKSDYGYRPNPFSGRGSEFHKGIDIKGNIGDSVRCTGKGIVEKADWDGGYGRCVVIRHEKNIRTIYGHLSEFNVNPGDSVNSGDVVGFVGSSGRSTGPHLHYEIRYKQEDINPVNHLKLN